MRRVKQLLKKNPLILFSILWWNLKVLRLKLGGKKVVIYNIHFDYFYDTFAVIESELSTKVQCYYSYDENRVDLKEFLQSKGCNNLIKNSISPFIYSDLFVAAEVTGPDFPFSIIKQKSLEIYHGTGVYNLYEKEVLLKRFDYHFAIGPQYINFFNDVAIDNYFKVGYPKTDKLFNGFYRRESICEEYSINDDRPIILYAPHWSEYSSIHAIGEQLINAVATLDVTVLIKVHNFIFTKYPDMNWRQRLQEIAKSSEGNRVKFVDESDTQKFYNISDMMITDVGTTAAVEYSLLKKPLFIYENQTWFLGREEMQPEWDVNQSAFLFKNCNQLVEKIDQIIHSDERCLQEIAIQQGEQEKIIENYFFNLTKASKVASEIIEREILNV